MRIDKCNIVNTQMMINYKVDFVSSPRAQLIALRDSKSAKKEGKHSDT